MVLNEIIIANNKEFTINCVSVGNPHCVIIKDKLDINEIKAYGPFIENHTAFPNKINTQFAKIINRNLIEILIWERGAGFTLASGSSASAVAAIMKKKGLIDKNVTIKMIGGTLEIEVTDDYNIKMTGEVRQICDGILNPELIEDFKTPMYT